MPVVALSWQQSLVLAVVLVLASIAFAGRGPTWVRRTVPFAREAAVIAGLYALWQLAGTLSVDDGDAAYGRGRWILHAEHDLRLPSEHDVQKLIATHRLLGEGCNVYYATMHFTAMFAFLVWMFVRHRAHYPAARTTLALVTLYCLLVQLMPVAPPRLEPGFTDTAIEYGQSVYGYGYDSLSAMPSVHVAWAVLIAWTVWRVSDSTWRWIGPAHAVITVFVVVATANHYWADGIVAVALLAFAAVTRGAARRVWDRVGPRPSSERSVLEAGSASPGAADEAASPRLSSPAIAPTLPR